MGVVNLTPVNGPIATAQAPQSSVSLSQIKAPYTELSETLQKGAEASEALAENTAKTAGQNAVTTDDQGNIQVQRAPILGPASQVFENTVKVGALAAGEGAARRSEIELRQQFRDDPQGYLAAADAFKKEKVDQYSKAAGPDVGIALGRVMDTTITQTWRGLQNEHERLQLGRADNAITAQINSARSDLAAMARGGADPNAPEFQQAAAKIDTLIDQKVANPRLAYPKEQADYEKAQIHSEISANRFLYNVDQTYQGAPSKSEGAKLALEHAKDVLTNPEYKLTEAQREQYYHKAVGEVRANEAIRKQDINDARAAGNELALRSAAGAIVTPDEVEQVASAHRAAGDPGGAARVYATYTRKPLNDDFGRQPIDAQAAQLNELRGMPRQKGAFDFFKAKGYTDAQAAGIVGGLRGETADLNPSQVHDGGIGLGISGWNGQRLRDLSDFAKANSLDPRNLNTQLEFVHHELQTTESAAGARLRAAQTPEEAGNAMLGYFRPKDFDKPGAHPERAAYARAAYNVFSGQSDATGKLPDGSLPTPAASSWLIANRARTVSSNARVGWQSVMQEYDKTGTRPPDQVVNGFVNAARASGDSDLLEGIARDTNRFAVTADEARQPLSTQQANITELKREGSDGSLSPGHAGLLKDLERRYDAITSGLKENAISTTVQNFPDKFRTPAPLDLANQDNLVAGLRQRGQIAQFASQNWGVKSVSALDSGDLKAVQAAMDGPDVATKARVLSAISSLPEQVRNATLSAVGSKGPAGMVQAAAGAVMSQDPELAQSILRGQMALKTDAHYGPDQKKEDFENEFSKRLPPATFSLSGRTDDSGPFAVAKGMVRARYADLSAASNDTSGKLNNDRLQQAVSDVTGGVLYHNGGTLIAPRRGMDQGTFDRTMAGVDDSDLAGITTLNGQPVTAAYLRNNAQLESVGDGRYMLRLGKDPLKPIYAYQNAGTEAPTKFVLDLRGRRQAAPAFVPGEMGPVL